MVLVLSFYTEYPDGMGDKNMFMDLSQPVGLEAALLVWSWYVVLEGWYLASLSDTSLILVNHKVAIFTSW